MMSTIPPTRNAREMSLLKLAKFFSGSLLDDRRRGRNAWLAQPRLQKFQRQAPAFLATLIELFAVSRSKGHKGHQANQRSKRQRTTGLAHQLRHESRNVARIVLQENRGITKAGDSQRDQHGHQPHSAAQAA